MIAERSKERSRAYRKRNHEAVLAANRAYRANNHDKAALWGRKARLKEHGWTLEEWDAAVERQGGLCAVPGCGRPVEVADHCHEGGHAREALCGGCNKALGLIADSPARARGLAVYLIRHGRADEASVA